MAKKQSRNVEKTEQETAPSGNGLLASMKPVSNDEYRERIARLRSASSRGGTSMYAPVAEAVKEQVSEDTHLSLTGTMNNVVGLRSYLKRMFGDKYTVSSAILEGQDGKKKNAQYAIFVTLATKEEEEEAQEASE